MPDLQANGFPPLPTVDAPNADFVQPLPEDAVFRRAMNLQFNPEPVDQPELPLDTTVAPPADTPVADTPVAGLKAT